MAHMVKGLAHKGAARDSDDEFFKLIDATGGWPLGYKYVGFEHTDERAAGFTNQSHNTGWWTVLYTSDDYYLWKLSPEALDRIAQDIHKACWVARPKTEYLKFRNSRGHVATIQKAPVKEQA